MNEKIEKIEVNYLVLENAIDWLSQGKNNGVEYASLDAIIRFLLKENLRLQDEIEKLKNK